MGIIVKKIDLAQRVLELEPLWQKTPGNLELDAELSLAGTVFGANPFKTARAILSKNGSEHIIQLQGIPSDEAPFHILEKGMSLPDNVVRELAKIYQEFQKVFTLPAGHLEQETDYRYCIGNGVPMMAVQMDMAALTDEELEDISEFSESDLHDFIIGKIFEIEGSIAAYGLLSHLFDDSSASSLWGENWRKALNSYRKKYKKAIVLLAPTEEKYESMLSYEFGLSTDEIRAGKSPTIDEVQELTGFDDFWGPDDYKKFLARHKELDENGFPVNHPLLYVRASNPTEKLKDPEFAINQPLLSSSEIRRMIRAFTLTPNIDNPDSPFEQHINDTKNYMPAMNLAFEVAEDDENVKLWMSNATNSNGSGSLKLMGKNKDNPMIYALRAFLESRSIDPEGDYYLRAKPTVDSFGGYGHLKLKFQNGRPGKMNILQREMKLRGSYMLQPELTSHSRVDAAGTAHREIWRLFFYTDAETHEIRPIAGIVNSIPESSIEVRGKVERVHGNVGATFREVILSSCRN